MNSYTLKMPHQVFGGQDALQALGALAQGRRRAAIFTDGGVCAAGLLRFPTEQLDAVGAAYTVFDDLPAEPTCEQAQAVVDRFRTAQADWIVAVGGGSVMDIAKLASVAVAPDITVRKLTQMSSLAKKSVFTVMLPTTAGTGAEATPNSIVSLPEQHIKVGIVNDALIPDAVILDAVFLRDLPRHIAAATGVDALCHALECYTSAKATVCSDLFAVEALRRIFASIEAACEPNGSLEHKQNMLLAAFYAGVAITGSGTTAVHALSYPLGGRYHIPHGVANAMLLVPILRFNAPACTVRLAQISDAVGGPAGSDEEKADWFVQRVMDIVHALDIPVSLARYGVTQSDIPLLVEAGMAVTRLLNNNPRPVTAQDAQQLYREIL